MKIETCLFVFCSVLLLEACTTTFDYSNVDTESLCYIGNEHSRERIAVINELRDRGAIRKQHFDAVRERRPKVGMNKCEFTLLAPTRYGAIVNTKNAENHFVKIGDDLYHITIQDNVVTEVKQPSPDN